MRLEPFQNEARFGGGGITEALSEALSDTLSDTLSMVLSLERSETKT